MKSDSTEASAPAEDPQPAPKRRKRTPKGSGRPPVPLSKRSLSHFHPNDRRLGANLPADESVAFLIDGSRVLAKVDDSDGQEFRVGVDWTQVPEERILHTFCECPRFSSGRPCRHVWATLLVLAESGPENQPPGRDRLSVRKDRAANWKDLGLEVTEEEERAAHAAAAAEKGRQEKRSRTRRKRSSGSAQLHRGVGTTWRTQLAGVQDQITAQVSPAAVDEAPLPTTPPTLFLINATASLGTNDLVLDLFTRKTSGGKAGKLKRLNVEPADIEGLLLPATSTAGLPSSVAVVAALGADPPARRGRSNKGNKKKAASGRVQRIRLPRHLYGEVLPHLCSQSVLGWWNGRSPGNPRPLAWDDSDPWQVLLRIELTAAGELRILGALERNGARVPMSDPVLILPGSPEVSPEPDEQDVPPGDEAGADENKDTTKSLIVFGTSIAQLDLVTQRDLPWIELFRKTDEIIIPRSDVEEALTTLLEFRDLPKLDAPDELGLSVEPASPRPRLVLEATEVPGLANPPLLAELSFDYGDEEISAGDPRLVAVDLQDRQFLWRNIDFEQSALVRLLELGVRPIESVRGHELELNAVDMPAVIEPLLTDGWSIEVQGASMTPPSPPSLKVESGIDWFELDGEVDFDGSQVEFSAILEAISRGDRFIRLENDKKGLLPASWMETYESLSSLAQSSSESGLRFLPSQALLVDALLSAMPPKDVDRSFAELRKKLQTLDRIKPKTELKTFGGTLRGYQRQGLGWLAFLREYGLGGVLADDMGLGKTVQVLALIQAYRTPSKSSKIPFLVVAPRSLVYNWIDEANHFTPKLKVLEYVGKSREAMRDRLNEFDIVVTTYGTLRRDISFLATFEFDTAILDEAQAIKNRDSQTAKASRLLNARHKLALTGTPIENHLGELGSIFEFLNPGLLGRLPRLDVLISGRQASRGELALVAEGMRPFILRRTKSQVLTDLPPKTEQTLHCRLHPRQRELYDQLRARYQATLLEQVEAKGMGSSSIQVLEALLRLRQIACHPGLVDTDWEEAGSGKLEALFEQVSEVLEEGHKVLVFSQFTKLLAYVRRHLDEQQIEYAYLDGKTRDRAAVVNQFQTDPDTNLFLISLKAGGLGLNLTAAGYVFLLDPWWNPAVEAQAIDRAHRIGQTQPVFAYRLIARDTVEEKILDLQHSKRKLADAILEADSTPLRDLTADDLRMLLS